MDTLFEFAVRGMKAQAEVNKLCQQPLAHTNDPLTSFEAAKKMVKSGKLNKQENEVYHAILIILDAPPPTDDFTAKEIASWCWIDYYKIQRRLSGLNNKGKIERTGEKRDGCCVWRLKNE